jgi:hypothetical protein
LTSIAAIASHQIISFRDSISLRPDSTTIGFLVLAFELLCRNTKVSIEAQRIKNGLPSVAPESIGLEQYAPLPMRTTRRMNAWQQQQAENDEAFWDQPSGRTTRRMNNAWY